MFFPMSTSNEICNSICKNFDFFFKWEFAVDCGNTEHQMNCWISKPFKKAAKGKLSRQRKRLYIPPLSLLQKHWTDEPMRPPKLKESIRTIYCHRICTKWWKLRFVELDSVDSDDDDELTKEEERRVFWMKLGWWLWNKLPRNSLQWIFQFLATRQQLLFGYFVIGISCFTNDVRNMEQWQTKRSGTTEISELMCIFNFLCFLQEICSSNERIWRYNCKNWKRKNRSEKQKIPGLSKATRNEVIQRNLYEMTAVRINFWGSHCVLVLFHQKFRWDESSTVRRWSEAEQSLLLQARNKFSHPLDFRFSQAAPKQVGGTNSS